MCSRSSIIMPSSVGLVLCTLPGQRKMLSFCHVMQFVSLCVLLLSDKDCESVRTTSPRTRWNLEVVLISLDRRRFVVVQPHSTLSLGS